jgi:hypothetical protein
MASPAVCGPLVEAVRTFLSLETAPDLRAWLERAGLATSPVFMPVYTALPEKQSTRGSTHKAGSSGAAAAEVLDLQRRAAMLLLAHPELVCPSPVAAVAAPVPTAALDSATVGAVPDPAAAPVAPLSVAAISRAVGDAVGPALRREFSVFQSAVDGLTRTVQGLQASIQRSEVRHVLRLRGADSRSVPAAAVRDAFSIMGLPPSTVPPSHACRRIGRSRVILVEMASGPAADHVRRNWHKLKASRYMMDDFLTPDEMRLKRRLWGSFQAYRAAGYAATFHRHELLVNIRGSWRRYGPFDTPPPPPPLQHAAHAPATAQRLAAATRQGSVLGAAGHGAVAAQDAVPIPPGGGSRGLADEGATAAAPQLSQPAAGGHMSRRAADRARSVRTSSRQSPRAQRMAEQARRIRAEDRWVMDGSDSPPPSPPPLPSHPLPAGRSLQSVVVVASELEPAHSPFEGMPAVVTDVSTPGLTPGGPVPVSHSALAAGADGRRQRRR